MAIFRFLQDGGRSPSWICGACVRTTHGGHLVVFIAVKNLVGIDAVVMAALCNRGPLYFCLVVSFYLSFYLSIFFSFLVLMSVFHDRS